ncbi:Hypothetical predicted protein [Paramuricea clavata]|uniref:Uncharacterized protein n=1 Tax=Paramuricea clavata TaxID=317549 RepID=A0A6S7HX02_PARCT|nr:Hypothetical predicted protein [Paramuricea clavata]
MARRKAKLYSRFDVATYMQEKKRLRKETALAPKTLAKKLDRLIYRIEEVSEERQIVSGDPQPELLTPPAKKKKTTFLSEKNAKARCGNPTVLSSNDKPGLSAQAMARRRTETFDAASEIHVASPENPLPTLVGLLDTVEKKCSQEVLVKFMSTSKKFKNVFSVIFKTASDNFEQSEANKLRSIGVYYSKGVMDKRKYRSTYRCLSMMRSPNGKSKTTRIKVLSNPLPRLLPYNKLASMLNEIEIGTLYSVRDTLCDDLECGEKVGGCYKK